MNTQQSLPNLVVKEGEAREKIQERIDKGQELRDLPICLEPELEEAKAEYFNWSDYNSNLLSRLFDDSSIANKYKTDTCFSVSGLTLEQEIGRYRRDVTNKINRLKGILGELELIPERIPGSSSISSPEQTVANGNEVFIVHGHDTAAKSEVAKVVEKLGPKVTILDEQPGRGQTINEVFIVHGHDMAAKHEVARFVEKLKLKVTILDEQPGRGQTIIEKLEAHASNTGFAIVLLTPDDIGESKDKPDNLKLRARQNVIFEMGYFVKGLGRDRVCVMSSEEVEIPSDLAGVEYIRLDADGGWQLKLVREMMAAGLTVDLEKVFKK